MKITTGYVAVRPDGKYLYMRKHKDTHEIAVVEDIDVASVRNQPGAWDAREAKALIPHDVTWRAVQVTREVVEV